MTRARLFEVARSVFRDDGAFAIDLEPLGGMLEIRVKSVPFDYTGAIALDLNELTEPLLVMQLEGLRESMTEALLRGLAPFRAARDTEPAPDEPAPNSAPTEPG